MTLRKIWKIGYADKPLILKDKGGNLICIDRPAREVYGPFYINMDGEIVYKKLTEEDYDDKPSVVEINDNPNCHKTVKRHHADYRYYYTIYCRQKMKTNN